MLRKKRTLKADVCTWEINLLPFWINRGRTTQETCDKGKPKDCQNIKMGKM